MASDIRIALDAMGGDHGPSVVVPGAAIALERRPDVQFLIYGDEKAIGPMLAAHPRLAARSRVFHTDVAVKMTDKPSQALRTGRRVSSMWQAIEAVKSGDADCVVSAGNTGALMAMAKFCLHTMAPIERPAIAAMWPTLRGELIVLDVGATIGGDERHLVDLAVMGAAMARIVFDIDSPTVGLLNVGVEEIKGVEEVKAAGRILRDANLPNMRYQGFVEGDDLGKGAVDVFVTEGFTGNIALEDRRRHRQAAQPVPARRDEPQPHVAHRLPVCAQGADGAARQNAARAPAGACFSDLTASSSRPMAAPTPRVTPARSNWAMTWCARNCSARFVK